MAFDTLGIKKIIDELSPLLESKIDKVYQPEKDELLLVIRTREKTYKLVLSASANNPRIHFTEKTKENPKTAPLFCMLLRKHLVSGKITAVSQPDFERAVQFDVESYNELGDLTKKHLIVEIMGRNSNIILTDNDFKIIDSVKHVDFTQSSVRQILPGLEYVRPPLQEKTAILSGDIKNAVIDFSENGMPCDKAIMAKISGISPVIAREIVFLGTGKTNIVCGELSTCEKEKITAELIKFAQNPPYNPSIIFDASGKPIDFSATRILQYGNGIEIKTFNTMSDVICEFYSAKDKKERMHQKSADLLKLLGNNLDRASKKLSIQQKTMKDAKEKERYKIYADLLTANLYRIQEGHKSIVVENYYEDGYPEIEIELLENLSPSKNAQRYYKLYNKLKNAEVEVAKQMSSTLSDIEYLESTLLSVENAQNEADLSEIRQELSELGYIKRQKTNKRDTKLNSKPMHFISSDGFDIYVGKNNTQNDYLTLKFANSKDIWFHTKNIHGSHTIIKLGIDKSIPKTTMTEAAALAAYYSKARESGKVPVDYTEIKNVKKPNGAKPGMVIYDNYNTIYVDPKNME